MIRRQRFPSELHDFLADVFQAFPGPVEFGFGGCAGGFEGGEVALGLGEDGAEGLVDFAGPGDGAVRGVG